MQTAVSCYSYSYSSCYSTETCVREFTLSLLGDLITRAHTHTLGFCFQGPLLQVRSVQVRLVPKSKLFGNYCGSFYRPDALPVAQPTASKH